MTFKCGGGTENDNPWTITRTPTTGPEEHEQIRELRFNSNTGEITGKHRQANVADSDVRGYCINSPMDAIVFMRPLPNPVFIYIGSVTQDADGSHASGRYSRINIGVNATATDEGTWVGERPPPFLIADTDNRDASPQTKDDAAATPGAGEPTEQT